MEHAHSHHEGPCHDHDDGHAGHQHNHAHGGEGAGLSTVARLAWSAAIFGVSGILQGVGGFFTGSLGLISDSLENFNDLVANLLSLTSLMVANRREPCEKFAYGWHRLEVVNTLLGSGMLLALAGGIIWEAVHRLKAPPAIQTGWVLVFCLSGLAMNLVAAVTLRPKDGDELERDANLKSAYLHAFSDALASVALLGSTVIIRCTGWRWLDPVVALGIVAFIIRGAYGLAADAMAILMHKAAFDHSAARDLLIQIPGITGVEDIRSWRLCSHLVVCTAHVLVDVELLSDTGPLLAGIEEVLADHFHVRHVTVHFETRSMAGGHHHRFVHQHEADEHHGHSHG